MKTFLFLISFFCVAFIGNAQYGPMTGGKTTTNADTVKLVPKISGVVPQLSFQVNVTKVSGTVAGTGILQCSEDNANWFTVPGSDTLTLTNGNNFKRWEIGPNKSLYYRVQVITSGTQSSTVSGYFYARRQIDN